MTVRSGLDNLPADAVRGQRLGLVTNQTGIDQQFRRTAQVLESAGATVAARFGAEHGFWGVEQAGVAVGPAAETDEAPVYSLYRPGEGEVNPYGPPPGSLAGLDGLVFDIQDVGVRYYTYPSTLGILLEGVDLPIYVVDRPNPLGGLAVEGPFVAPAQRSFVGRYDLVPVRHGLTLGELARLINHVHLADRANLKVWPLDGWDRSMEWEAIGLPWLATSPNLPTLTTARLYSGTCLIEGTNLSAGRGTTQPFELIGAPWLERPDRLAAELNSLARPGLYFRDTFFKPTADLYAGQVCGGVQVHITDRAALSEVVRSGLHLVAALARLYPSHFQWRETHFDRLIGSPGPRELITRSAGDPAALTALFEEWAASEARFQEIRQTVLLY